MLLLDDPFLEKLAAAVVEGVEDFLDRLRPITPRDGPAE